MTKKQALPTTKVASVIALAKRKSGCTVEQITAALSVTPTAARSLIGDARRSSASGDAGRSSASGARTDARFGS